MDVLIAVLAVAIGVSIIAVTVMSILKRHRKLQQPVNREALQPIYIPVRAATRTVNVPVRVHPPSVRIHERRVQEPSVVIVDNSSSFDDGLIVGAMMADTSTYEPPTPVMVSNPSFSGFDGGDSAGGGATSNWSGSDSSSCDTSSSSDSSSSCDSGSSSSSD